MAVAYFNETDRYNRRINHLEKLFKCQENELETLKFESEQRIQNLKKLIELKDKEIDDLKAKLVRLHDEPTGKIAYIGGYDPNNPVFFL